MIPPLEFATELRERREELAKLIVQAIVWDRGAPLDLESAWLLAPGQVKKLALDQVEHAAKHFAGEYPTQASSKPRRERGGK